MESERKIRKRLQEEKAWLQAQLEQLKGGSNDNDVRREGSPYGKREEEASVVSEFEKRLALEQQLSESLEKVNAALERMKEGTYGICTGCGNKINPERLEALPYATLCVECKAKEKKGRNR